MRKEVIGVIAVMLVGMVVAKPEFVIMGWSSIPAHQISVERYQEMREAGFTHSLSHIGSLEVLKRALDAAQSAGIKLSAGCDELKSDPEGTVKAIKDHPALGFYTLRDEPHAKDFPELAAWAKRIQALDKEHPCYINLYPNNANSNLLGTETYREHVRLFVETLDLPFYSFDYYPFMAVEPPQEFPWHIKGAACYLNPQWYLNLEEFSEEMKRVNKPFWGFSLATAHVNPPIGYYPVATVAAMKLQQYSNLAYGAQGLQFFTYWTPNKCEPMFFHDGPMSQQGKRTPVYERVREVIQELQARAFIFLGSEMQSVWHTGATLPTGTKPLGELPPFVKSFEILGGGAVVSHLRNGQQEYLVVVNRELDAMLTLNATFAPGIQRIRKDGTMAPAAAYSGSYWLDPGDAEIFVK